MKRMAIAVTVLLTTAGMAFGAASFSITGPGGVSTFEPVPGQEFPIAIHLVTDEPIISWSMILDGPPGYMLPAFPGFPIVYGNNPIWAIPGTAPWSTTQSVPFPVPIGGTVADPWVPFDGGLVFQTNVVAPAVITPGMIFGPEALVGTMDFEDIPASVSPLMITPEPAGALLLLAGALMLRRRR